MTPWGGGVETRKMEMNNVYPMVFFEIKVN